MEQHSSRLSTLSGSRSLKELKNIEWIFIGIHSLGVPTAIVMALMHEPSSAFAVSVIAGLMGAWSVVVAILNHRIASIDGQVRLAIATQAIIVLFAWALVFQVVSGENTAAYAGFTVVIIEGAVRFGLRGSLVMGVVFALALVAAMEYREWEYGLSFNVPGYVFWAILSLIVALVVGLVTEENRRERGRSESLVRQRTLLEERQRIARDLHDSVLKTLHGLGLEAHALKRLAESPAAAEKAAYIEGVCEGSTQEIRDIIAELRSEEEHEGMASLLSRMVKSWGEAAGIETEVAVSGDDRRPSLLVSYNLRNILAEALLNVQKHAGATRVSVSLELLPGELRLEISDNGKGMAESGGEVHGVASKGKYGVLGMKERVEQLNGQFSIDGSHGTRLLISIPLPSDK
jgi:signal transduction histidine kinase